MDVIIIEDEQYTAEDLKKNLRKIDSNITVRKILVSVKEATFYLQNNPHPDLFFSDVQLGDGLSFEIFKNIKTTTPVIFITAFDEYALNAFNANGIDYILKPFSFQTITNSINKFKTLTLPKANNIDKLLSHFQHKNGTVIVYYKDKVIPINGEDIALFYTENDLVKALCFDGKEYTTNLTLEESEKSMGQGFFRANRQHLVNRKAIIDMSQHFGRKLLLNLKIVHKESILVSKEKSNSFLDWLANSHV